MDTPPPHQHNALPEQIAVVRTPGGGVALLVDGVQLALPPMASSPGVSIAPATPTRDFETVTVTFAARRVVLATWEPPAEAPAADPAPFVDPDEDHEYRPGDDDR